MAGTNKRRARRERHDSALEIYEEGGRAVAWSAKLVDFSTAGVCFLTPRVLKTGEHLRARARIFGKGVFEIFGQVVWSRARTNATFYGVRFDSVKNLSPAGEKE